MWKTLPFDVSAHSTEGVYRLPLRRLCDKVTSEIKNAGLRLNRSRMANSESDLASSRRATYLSDSTTARVRRSDTSTQFLIARKSRRWRTPLSVCESDNSQRVDKPTQLRVSPNCRR